MLIVVSPFSNPWVGWAGGFWGHMQGAVSGVASLMKPDLWASNNRFYTWLLCCGASRETSQGIRHSRRHWSSGRPPSLHQLRNTSTSSSNFLYSVLSTVSFQRRLSQQLALDKRMSIQQDSLPALDGEEREGSQVIRKCINRYAQELNASLKLEELPACCRPAPRQSNPVGEEQAMTISKLQLLLLHQSEADSPEGAPGLLKWGSASDLALSGSEPELMCAGNSRKSICSETGAYNSKSCTGRENAYPRSELIYHSWASTPDSSMAASESCFSKRQSFKFPPSTLDDNDAHHDTANQKDTAFTCTSRDVVCAKYASYRQTRRINVSL